eukprot:1166555-Pleurochrysis_carterae.AAC.4
MNTNAENFAPQKPRLSALPGPPFRPAGWYAQACRSVFDADRCLVVEARTSHSSGMDMSLSRQMLQRCEQGDAIKRKEQL